jgi:hypothetical protein
VQEFHVHGPGQAGVVGVEYLVVVNIPTVLIFMQRVHFVLLVDSCRVIVTMGPGANPSRLKLTVLVALSAVNVSLPLKAFCTRQIGSPASHVPLLLRSENTIQPVCQDVEVAEVAHCF